MEKDEVFRILKYAHDQGIKNLIRPMPTGKAKILSKSLSHGKKFHLILFRRLKRIRAPFTDAVETSLQTLQQEPMYGLLVHSYEDFNSQPALWNDLRNLKKRKSQKYRFLLYSPDELDDLFDKKIDFDMVQFPYNLFDRRFESRFQN